MPKRNRFDVTLATGTIRRGKYTLPNRPLFVTNVFEVLLRQSEKYCHIQVPAR